MLAFPYLTFDSYSVRLVVPTYMTEMIRGGWCCVWPELAGSEKLNVLVTMPVESARTLQLPTLVTTGTVIDVLCEGGAKRFKRCKVDKASTTMNPILYINARGRNFYKEDFSIEGTCTTDDFEPG